jgi:hypothetical protein
MKRPWASRGPDVLRSASLLVAVALCVASSGAAQGADPTLAASGDEERQLAGQRLEVADVGVAVTVPPDWIVLSPHGETYAVSPTGADCRLTGSRLDEPVDDPDAFIERVAAMYPNFADGGPLPVVDEDVVMLPAARSIRLVVDLSLKPDEAQVDEGRFITTYLLTIGRVLAFFACWANERPEDDWLAIAETFEFLPDEAQAQLSPTDAREGGGHGG